MLRDLPGKHIKCCPKEHQPHPAEYNPTQLLCCSGPGDLPTPYPPLLLFEAGDVAILMLILDVAFIFSLRAVSRRSATLGGATSGTPATKQRVHSETTGSSMDSRPHPLTTLRSTHNFHACLNASGTPATKQRVHPLFFRHRCLTQT